MFKLNLISYCPLDLLRLKKNSTTATESRFSPKLPVDIADLCEEFPRSQVTDS